MHPLPRVIHRLLAFLLFLFGSIGFSEAPPSAIGSNGGFDAPLNRQPEAPAWEIDLTDRLARVRSPDAPEPGESITEALSREARATHLPVPDETFWWRVPVELPAEADSSWPVVVEWDESRLVPETRFDGDALGKPFIARARAWTAGEGAVVLPLSPARRGGLLAFRAAPLTQLYDTGFGRVRLRPAEALEAVHFQRNNGAPALLNRSALPLTVKLRWVREDFFGVPLAAAESTIALAPGARVETPPPASIAQTRREGYKTRITYEIAGRRSPEFWLTEDELSENVAQTERLPVTSGWEMLAVEGAFGPQPPTEGWRRAERPRVSRNDWKTRRYWMRTQVSVPATWRGPQVRLYLGRVLAHAVVFVNGQRLGEIAQWQTPGFLSLPESIRPGARVELAFAVTDFSYGLRPGLTPPANGVNEPPGNRALAAPISASPPGLDRVELIGTPAVRTDFAALRTQGKRVAAWLDLRNDSGSSLRVRPRVLLLERGREIARRELPDAVVPARGSAAVVAPALDAPDAVLWTPETPALYEYRIELLDAGARVVDTRRERFGFRVFDVRDDHFTLNGERVNLWGNSHSVAFAGLASNQWPAGITTNRFPRLYAGSTSRLALAAESGLLTKLELGSHAALHRDLYAYDEPLMWSRIDEQLRAMARPEINNPAIVFIDVGNELSFPLGDEPKRMVEAYARYREFDPTRLVVNSGGHPALLAGAPVQDWHAWPNLPNRADWFFYHPEERPSYQRGRGFFVRRPSDEPAENWTIVREGALPKEPAKLHALENPPILFSEGHYNESSFYPAVNGPATWVPIPEFGEDHAMAVHALNWIGTRKWTVQAARVAGFPGNLIHVDRGIGRWIQPLAAASVDRRFRFVAGERMETRVRVLHDLAGTREVTARFRLYDGETSLGEKSARQTLAGGQFFDVDLDFPLPRADADRDYRLNIDVRAEGYGGYFRDDLSIVAFAPVSPVLPAGQKLFVFDPRNRTTPHLERGGVAFTRLQRLGDWRPAADNTLLIGSEALNDAPASDLPGLREKVERGGRLIVLDHRSLPSFLKRRLVQSTGTGGIYVAQGGPATGIAMVPGPTVLTRGLLSRDFLYWNTADRDWITEWGSLELPSTGLARVHVERGGEDNKVGAAPLLEVAEGEGRVVFCQLNLQAALGHEPAADRVLANLLQWTAAPSPFAPPEAAGAALIVFADARRLGVLRERMGLEGVVDARPSASRLANARLIVLDGADAELLRSLDADALRRVIEAGATLFVQDPGEGAASWLARFSGAEIGVEAYPHGRAHLLERHPLTAGLTHGSFFVGPSPSIGAMVDMNTAQAAKKRSDNLADFRLVGAGAKPLLRPAFLGEVALGRGRIVLSTIRTLEYPVTKPLMLGSTVLANCGARLVAGGLVDPSAATRWNFTPIKLDAFMNWPLADEPGGRRGLHGQGPDNDLRFFPRGRQNFKGVDYELVDPDRLGGNGVIALAGKGYEGKHPAEVKGIQVRRKAERLYFLHNSAWGRPDFVYRVYYTEDRARWIPGQPAPYVDVLVKGRENSGDLWGVNAIEDGTAFLPGATVAWSGENAYLRSRGVRSGVFQMVWENPNPEKEIESIDILSPGQGGHGQIFVYAITAASRAPAATPPPRLTLSEVMPEGAPAPRVETHWQGERYGLVLLKDGSVPVVHDRRGRPLFALPMSPGVSAPEKIETHKAADGAQIFQLTGSEPGYAWTKTLTARPGALRVEWSWTPSGAGAARPSGLELRVTAPVDAKFARFGVNPIDVPTDHGTLLVGWDPRLATWMKHYRIEHNGRFTFFPFDTAWESSRTFNFWVEIGL